MMHDHAGLQFFHKGKFSWLFVCFCLQLLLAFSADAVFAQTPSSNALPPIASSREGFDKSLLEPVDGIDYRAYGHATYALFRDPNGDQEAILDKLGLTKARFDEANKIYGERMKADPTFAMVEMFGAYFNETAGGPYAAYARDAARSVLDQVPLQEKEPMPEEKFREIQVYYARKASVAGTDLAKQDEVLKPYGLTFNDFNILGSWFSRRLTLQAGGLVQQGSETKPQDQPAKEHPEWGGLWHFTYQLLERTDQDIRVKEQTRDVCLKPDMTEATLPLMPKPQDAKCVLNHLNFFETGIEVDAQCDHGDYGSDWGLSLRPKGEGQFAGEISYNETNENDDDLPQPTTPVTAKRLGDCQ
ncbi:DUF3617 domain-containing protein [Oryzifoliimicrobium ureilyticus]|uniref:DUF3617 domain-containing protein n=1 Tax=Oryzifoliimicrobium ureilyticus TaxID=3113724 RepID=UPI00307629EC